MDRGGGRRAFEGPERAIDLGLNFIDTALGYGDGHSERLVGQAVRERDERIYAATRIPPKNLTWPRPPRPEPGGDLPGRARPGVHAERSLENLGLETIDVQQFHV